MSLKLIAGIGVLAILIGTVPAAYFGLERGCSLEQHRDSEHAQSASSGEQNAAPQGEQPNPTATFDLRITDTGKIDGRYYAKDAPREKKDWTHKFWCDSKIGEFVLAVFTLFLVLFTGGLWFSTHRLWAAGEKTLTATQRPWVKINDIKPGSDLVFSDDKATLTLNVFVGNKGKSPGLRVRIDAALIASNDRNVFDAQRSFAAKFRRPRTKDVPELTSWPGDGIGMPVIAEMDAIELARCRAIAETKPDHPVIFLTIIGCITYEFDFAPGWHQTGLLYRLSKTRLYPGAHLHDEIANAEGAIWPNASIEKMDLKIDVGLEGTGPVD